MAGNVDQREPPPVGQLERRIAEVDRDPTRLLFGQPVGVGACQRHEVPGLAMVDVPGGADRERHLFVLDPLEAAGRQRATNPAHAQARPVGALRSPSLWYSRRRPARAPATATESRLITGDPMDRRPLAWAGAEGGSRPGRLRPLAERPPAGSRRFDSPVLVVLSHRTGAAWCSCAGIRRARAVVSSSAAADDHPCASLPAMLAPRPPSELVAGRQVTRSSDSRSRCHPTEAARQDHARQRRRQWIPLDPRTTSTSRARRGGGAARLVARREPDSPYGVALRTRA